MTKKSKYRSKFEQLVSTYLPSTFEYESEKHSYTISRVYVPDFVFEDIWIEVKGFFRPGDVAKYKAIREQYPNKRLIFIFSNPNKKVRKNAKSTMADWAIKNGWEYIELKDITKVL